MEWKVHKEWRIEGDFTITYQYNRHQVAVKSGNPTHLDLIPELPRSYTEHFDKNFIETASLEEKNKRIKK